jgi:hypothetical protein
MFIVERKDSIMISDYILAPRDIPSTTDMTTSVQVGDTNQYEGKDNPGTPGYYRRSRMKKADKKEQKKSNHKVDLIA